MRQICINCLKPVDVPESAAGGSFACPSCGERFAVPKAYAPTVEPETYAVRNEPPPPRPSPVPAVDRPAPPPGFVPPGAVPPPVAPTNTETQSRGLTLSPKIVGWVPVACLTLAFVLTFFPWAGAYPGGHRVFSQNAWEASFGWVYAPAAAVPEAVQQVEPEIKTFAPPNLLILLYVVLLIVTVLFAWADRVITTELTVTTVPGPLAWLPGVWPYRFVLLLGLAALLLVLVLFQAWRGFGLESSVEQYAANRNDAALKAADTAAKKQIAEVQTGMEAAKFAVRETTVLDVVLLVHIVVVLGLLARAWLARRGDQPPPRVVVQY